MQSRIMLRFPEASPAQEVRLAVAEASARTLLDELSTRDPDRKPTPSLTSTIEGAIAAAEAEMREARDRLLEIDSAPAPSKSLDAIFRPGGVPIGKPGDPDVSIVSRGEFDELLKGVVRGAEEITPAKTYQGLWYRRSDGTVFGLRRSKKNGLTIDIIDSLGNPALVPGRRFHFDD